MPAQEVPWDFTLSVKLSALFAEIRLGQKLLTLKNTLAYYDEALITPAKSFLMQDTKNVCWTIMKGH